MIHEVGAEGILYLARLLVRDEDQILSFGTEGINGTGHQSGLVFHQHTLGKNIALAENDTSLCDQRIDHPQE